MAIHGATRSFLAAAAVPMLLLLLCLPWDRSGAQARQFSNDAPPLFNGFIGARSGGLASDSSPLPARRRRRGVDAGGGLTEKSWESSNPGSLQGGRSTRASNQLPKLPPGSLVINTGDKGRWDLQSRVRLALSVNGLALPPAFGGDEDEPLEYTTTTTTTTTTKNNSNDNLTSRHVVKYHFQGSNERAARSSVEDVSQGTHCRVECRGLEPVSCELDDLASVISEFPEDCTVHVSVKGQFSVTARAVLDLPPTSSRPSDKLFGLPTESEVVVLFVDTENGRVPKTGGSLAVFGDSMEGGRSLEDVVAEARRKVNKCRRNHALRNIPELQASINALQRKLGGAREEIGSLSSDKLVEAVGAMREK